MKKVSIGDGHTYAQEFKKFVDSKLFNRLKEKYRIKPYHEQNKNLRLVVLISSYLFNLLSIVTAFYFVFTILHSFLHGIIAILASITVLICLEAFKRLVIPSAFKQYYQFSTLSKSLILLSLGMILLSGFLSFNGGNTAVTEYVGIEVDTLPTELSMVIANRIEQQKELSKVKYKGTTTRTAQRAINAIQKEINVLRSQETKEIAQIAQGIEGQKATNSYHGFILSLFALIFDLALIFCLWYLEHYDYRSLSEFSEIDGGDTAETRQDIDPTGGEVKEVITNDTKEIADTAKNNCLNCSKPFELTAPNKKFCCTKCRVNHWEQKNKKVLSVPTV